MLRMEEGAILYRVTRTGIFEKVIFEWRSEGSESEPRKVKNVLSKDHADTEVPKQELPGLFMLKIQERGWSGRSREQGKWRSEFRDDRRGCGKDLGFTVREVRISCKGRHD